MTPTLSQPLSAPRSERSGAAGSPLSPRGLLPATLTTARLRLRRPVAADASRIASFIGDWDVARMLARVPYPYREADAQAWIAAQAGCGDAVYAIVHANGVIGVVSLEAQAEGAWALGYWLAKPFWGRGLMTEAAAAVTWSTRVSGPRPPITSAHADDNPASGRVLEKIGFEATGETKRRFVARNADVRLLTYRLPAAPAVRPASPPV